MGLAPKMLALVNQTDIQDGSSVIDRKFIFKN